MKRLPRGSGESVTNRSTSPAARVLLAMVLALVVIAGTATRLASMEAPLEFRVKAAFLYNFAKFIRWPAHSFAGPDAPFVLGIYAPDPFEDALEPLLRKTIANRRFTVRRFDANDDIGNCHILFLPTGAGRRISEALAVVAGQSVLTVTDDGGAGEDAIIHLIVRDNRVTFDINNRLARQAGLGISSKLLNLANQVRD